MLLLNGVSLLKIKLELLFQILWKGSEFATPSFKINDLISFPTKFPTQNIPKWLSLGQHVSTGGDMGEISWMVHVFLSRQPKLNCFCKEKGKYRFFFSLLHKWKAQFRTYHLAARMCAKPLKWTKYCNWEIINYLITESEVVTGKSQTDRKSVV